MSPELCYKYFQRVSIKIQKFGVSSTIPFHCFLRLFLQNIYDILPETFKRRIIQDYIPIENLKLWNILGMDRIVEDNKKEQLGLILTKKLQGFLDDFLQENITVDKYYEMVSVITFLN